MADCKNPKEVKDSFLAYKNDGIGVSIGVFEENIGNPYFKHNSKEAKLWRKISDYSYEYHNLDENLQYVHPENEHR